MGAVLAQGPARAPLGFFSKKLSGAELNYSAFDRELLGVFLAIKHFQAHLEGQIFTVYTDHKPLCGALLGSAPRSPRQARHLSFISEFTTDLRYIKGSDNFVADTLSRPSVAAVSVPLAPQVDLRSLASAQGAATEEVSRLRASNTSLILQDIQHPLGFTLLCDVSFCQPRPVVPVAWRRRVFDAVHGIAHPAGRTTLELVRRHFVWFRMSSDVRRWARECSACQRSKVAQHVRAPLQTRPPPDRRFGSLHVDLVGPLPESKGCRYLFTIIDRFTRWMEAVPLKTMTAVDCARALVETWIVRYGAPSDVVSDQGRQFVSSLWAELLRLCGITSARTTAYHPQANGMVERLHRTLKERLMARGAGAAWMDHLPAVLLGLRAAVREDAGVSPAELVFGAPLRLPGSFLGESVDLNPAAPSAEYVDQLRRTFSGLGPAPVVHHSSSVSRSLPSALLRAQFVYVRVDAVRTPLVPPYDGPYRVLESGRKTFTPTNMTETVDMVKKETREGGRNHRTISSS